MKKVAIVTLMRNPNYGNVLQNIAMQRIFEKRGCMVETIINKTKSSLFVDGLIPVTKQYINCILNRNNARKREKRRRRFLACCKRNIRYSDICYNNGFSQNITNKYDLFVAGSDQIWNPWFGLATDYEFLGFAPKEKIRTYAASFGIAEFEKLSENKRKEMLSYINRFQCVSCREISGADFISENTNVPAYAHLDPTMLLDKEEWRSMERMPKCDLPEKYIFVYMLGKMSDEYRNIIEKKAECLGAGIINILDERFSALDPLEFLWLIDHSLAVCTDSFHACVFSVLFGKTFNIFDRIDSYESQNTRFETLLEKLSIPKETVVVTQGRQQTGEIDWVNVYANLEAERRYASEYLDSCIG